MCVYVLIVYIIPIVMYSEMVLQSNLQLGWYCVVEMNFCVLQNTHNWLVMTDIVEEENHAAAFIQIVVLAAIKCNQIG